MCFENNYIFSSTGNNSHFNACQKLLKTCSTNKIAMDAFISATDWIGMIIIEIIDLD